MENKIKINFRNLVTKEFPVGTSLYEISKSFTRYFNYEIMIGKIDNRLIDLSEKINQDCNIEFYDRSSDYGNVVYARGTVFMLVLAVRNVLGEKVEVTVEHSIDKGIYCELAGAEVDEELIKKLEKEMHEIHRTGLLYTKINVSRADAIKYFTKKNQMDKVRVLKYISNSYINLYRLDDYYDYFYGELPYTTHDINSFKLDYLKDNGFVLSYPSIENPEVTLDFTHHEMMYQTFLDYTKWGRVLNIENAADLNEMATTGKYDDLIRMSEANFNSQISHIAHKIKTNKTKIKLVLIAGPSSSGKTTTSKKLEVYIQSNGIKTHQISLDDYFKNRAQTPRDENGEFDYESIKAIDVDLFNKDLTKLFAGEEVWMPEYNFISGEREYKKKYLKIDKNDVIIIEGLHGLSEDLTMAVERKNKFKIYLSPLTQLNVDNHNRIHTTDTRKIRRIIRDNKFRNYNASDTLKMWPKIRDGEVKYIYPFQDEADVILNSALVYEMSVLKIYAEPLLYSVESDDPMYPEAMRLINFLRNFLPMPSDNVPQDSVLREFIGGSCFRE